MSKNKSASIIYREADIDDLIELRRLEQCVVEAERPYNGSIKGGFPIYYDLESLILSDCACVVLAQDSSDIIGTGYAHIQLSKESLRHKKHAYLGFMYVSVDYRGQMINQKIMNELIDWSKKNGIFDFYLDVYSQNIGAIKAYQKVGFTANMIEMKLNLDA